MYSREERMRIDREQRAEKQRAFEAGHTDSKKSFFSGLLGFFAFVMGGE